MDKEREEFEKDAASRGMIMSKNPDGTYRSSMTQPAWLSWQSAQAPLLAEIERLNAIKLTVEALDDRDLLARIKELEGKILPDNPAEGEGRLWSGTEWLAIAPGMEDFAIIRMLKVTTELRADLKIAVEALIAVQDAQNVIESNVVATKALSHLAKYGEG